MLLLFVSLSPALAFAQAETGQMVVKAIDPQGAVISGATVKVRSVERGTEVTSTTNDEGVATITNLQPGLYEVTVEGGGFAPFTQRAQVTVGARLSVDAMLSAQAQSAVVNVVAGEGGVEVNTQTQELSNVVSSTQIRELPTLTRNPYNLVGLSGNVSEGDPQNLTMRGAGFNINGQRSASTNILLDGGENVDTFTATVGQSVPLDSVQEFRVITSNFSAEYGRATGGIVNVTTRAGSNDFHGTLFEFNRVSALASNDFDNNARGFEKDVFTRNQFGYSVGGRIIKDKLFFFSSTEWIRVRSQSSQSIFVPAQALIASSNARTQAIFDRFPLRSGAVAGRTLTVSDVVNQLGIGAGAFSALPGGLPAFQEVRFTTPADVGGGLPQNSYQTVGRIDWNVSDITQIYGRYALESQDFFPGTNAFSPFAGFDTGTTNFNNNFLLNLTHTWSPTSRFAKQAGLQSLEQPATAQFGSTANTDLLLPQQRSAYSGRLRCCASGLPALLARRGHSVRRPAEFPSGLSRPELDERQSPVPFWRTLHSHPRQSHLRSVSECRRCLRHDQHHDRLE